MRTILLASLLLFTACKKKEETKAADPTTTAVEKKADDTAAPAPTPTTPTAPAAPAKTISSAAEYETLGIDMTNKLLALFVANGKDCDKLAAGLTKFGDDNRPVFEALKAFEKANPEAEKAFDAKMKPREKEFEEKIGPAFEACQGHEGMKKAMQNMPMN